MYYSIKGRVEKFVTIHPVRVNMKGKPGEVVSQNIIITPEQKFPFKVVKSHMQKGKPFDLEVKEDVSTGLPRYIVTISNPKNMIGRVYDSIVLETDSEIRPEIKIFVAAAFMNQQGAGQ